MCEWCGESNIEPNLKHTEQPYVTLHYEDSENSSLRHFNDEGKIIINHDWYTEL